MSDQRRIRQDLVLAPTFPLNDVDGQSPAEQIAELQLLARVEHQYASSTLDEVNADQNTRDEHEYGERPNTSFTAIFGAQRINTASSLLCYQSDASLSRASPAARHNYVEESLKIDLRLPTLSEDDDSDDSPEKLAVPFNTELNNGEQEQRVDKKAREAEDDPIIETSSHDPVMDNGMTEEGYSDQDKKDDESDEAFHEMLSQLSNDLSCLSLAVGDITLQKLRRVRAVLTSLPPVVSSQHSHSGTWVKKMRIVRTITAIDTIDLLLRRYEIEDVLQAITVATRSIFEWNAAESNIEPLAQASITITSYNIAKIVLLARETLACASPSKNDCSKEKSLPLSPLRSKSSTDGASSPRRTRRNSSSTSLPSSPSTPGRRSILAQDGTHVLMQEKIAAFDHRGSGHGLPIFKVRGESMTAAQSAALRRHKAIKYGNDVTKAHRTGTTFDMRKHNEPHNYGT